MMISTRFAALGITAALVLAACGSGQDQDTAAPARATDAPASAEGVTIEVANIAFKPPEMRVLRSTEVTWVNKDADVPHTVTSGVGGTNAVAGVSDGEPNKPTGLFDGELPSEGSFSFTFNELGEFSYFCEIHPSMRGTVIVE